MESLRRYTLYGDIQKVERLECVTLGRYAASGCYTAWLLLLLDRSTAKRQSDVHFRAVSATCQMYLALTGAGNSSGHLSA